jgi:hypothetical protein
MRRARPLINVRRGAEFRLQTLRRKYAFQIATDFPVRTHTNPNLCVDPSVSIETGADMNNLGKLTLVLVLAFGLAACAAGTPSSETAAHNGAAAQFLLGFWHGIIAPVTLIGEIIEKVSPRTLPWTFRFYEVSNTGVFYDLGFFIGMGAGPSVIWTGATRRRI